MCGIIGYTGSRPAVPILLEGLGALEYRGYDSAGIATHTADGICIVRSVGQLRCLTEQIDNVESVPGTCGIGHTRWATHGEPSLRNAHPHATERVALVHNGIIENYAELERILSAEGYVFESDTDTERGLKLIDLCYRKHQNPITALFEAATHLRGSYAFGVIFTDIPGKIYAMRRDSPLIVAKSVHGGLIASDIPAILPHTNAHYRLDEGIVAEICAESIHFFSAPDTEVSQKERHVDWSVEQAQRGGFTHFMLKEIFDEPEALRKTISAHTRCSLPYFGCRLPQKIHRLHIVACGTAMHAGLVGKSIIEQLSRVPVSVEIASEFRYRDAILDDDDMVLLISQSGETADTLAALRYAKSRGIKTLAIVNVVGSSVAREADFVIYTGAGPEIAVASTKAYSVQLSVLYLLALHFALARGTMSAREVRALCADMLSKIPEAVQKAIEMSDRIRDVARKHTNAEHMFYIGRGLDYDLCVEGSLKLKEISYIHSEAYAAGELKHGTISLIKDGTPVIALSTVPRLCEKTISSIREVISRGALVTCICSAALACEHAIPCADMIMLPSISDIFAPFPTATLLQLFAYHTAALKGHDVDKPRNLAKSVTVE